MMEGQKVVCVNDAAPEAVRQHYTQWIQKGRTYVIRGVFLGVDQRANPGEVGLYLLGVHNPRSSVAPFPERGFNSDRFRLIEEKKSAASKREEAFA